MIYLTNLTFCSVEQVLKAIAFGLLFGRNALLRSPWSRFDLVVVAASLPSLLPATVLPGSQVSLIALRVFGVLRLFRYAQKYKVCCFRC